MERRHFLRTASLVQKTVKQTLVATCSLMALTTAGANADAGDGNWYFFGDSNVGQGNFSAIVGSRGDDFYPNSSNNGFERDSNGLIWAELMGRDVDIILDPDLDSGNINFGISGAHMTRGGDLVPFGVETGVLVQTETFRDLVAQDALSVGSEDVAFMIAGANDFFDRLDAGEDAGTIIADVAGAAATNIANLRDAGIKTVIISEVQPLQYATYFRGDDETKAELAEMVNGANEAMFAAIDALGVRDDVNVVTLKYENLMQYLTANAAELGFDEVDVPCYDGEAGTLCADDLEGQNRYLYLDDLHMTEKGHALVARWWRATLDGANGNASRQTARMPDVIQYSHEAVLNRLGNGQRRVSGDRDGLFADVIYETPNLMGMGRDADVDLTLKGGVIGAESGLGDHWHVGGALSFTKADADVLTGGEFKTKTKALHAWAGYQLAPLSLGVIGTYGETDVEDITRVTGVPLYTTAQNDTSGEFWDIGASIATNFHIGKFSVKAEGAYHYGKVELEGYTETGATGLALTYADQTKKSQRLELNADMRGPAIHFGRKKDVSLTTLVGAHWRHALGARGHDVTSQLLENTANPVTITTAGFARDRLTAQAGLELAFAEKWAITGRYSRTWADDISKGDSFNVSLRVAF